MQKRIQSLAPGTKFVLVIDERLTRRGEVIYVTPCRARVRYYGEPIQRTFTTAKGKEVSFTDSGSHDTSIALECMVEVEEVARG